MKIILKIGKVLLKFDGEKYLGSLGLSKSERPWLWTKSLETNTTK
jgi:hypothetical protein